ncbi:MAG: AhpC/TSA family protein [Gammaproteobacteria bacterium]|nr:AhpC/TSA family protein [Gammaproteobacteria bacterium]
MSLQEKLDALKVRLSSQYPPELSKVVSDFEKETLMMFLEDKALKRGDTLPDAFFFDGNMRKVKLRELNRDKHLVISFFRGTWCPYCNLELKALGDVHKEISARGALLIAASPELFTFTEKHIKDHHLDYLVMTDLNNEAAKLFGLVFQLPVSLREVFLQVSLDLEKRNGENSWLLPMPATFIVDKNGTIASTFVNADYTKRMEPDDILAELDKLSQPAPRVQNG